MLGGSLICAGRSLVPFNSVSLMNMNGAAPLCWVLLEPQLKLEIGSPFPTYYP